MKLSKLRTPRDGRHAHRVHVGWEARYRLDSHGPWHTCRVIDVSLEGAALELPEGAYAPRSRLIFLELARAGALPAGVALRADVRSLSFARNGHHRIGVMFVNVTSLERDFLVAMIEDTGETDDRAGRKP